MLLCKVKACENILTARPLGLFFEKIFEALNQLCPALLYFLVHALGNWWWEALYARRLDSFDRFSCCAARFGRHDELVAGADCESREEYLYSLEFADVAWIKVI